MRHLNSICGSLFLLALTINLNAITGVYITDSATVVGFDRDKNFEKTDCNHVYTDAASGWENTCIDFSSYRFTANDTVYLSRAPDLNKYTPYKYFYSPDYPYVTLSRYPDLADRSRKKFINNGHTIVTKSYMWKRILVHLSDTVTITDLMELHPDSTYNDSAIIDSMSRLKDLNDFVSAIITEYANDHLTRIDPSQNKVNGYQIEEIVAKRIMPETYSIALGSTYENSPEITMYDSFGKKVFIKSSKANSNTINICTSSLSSGVYFLKIGNNKRARTIKLLISKS